MRRLQLIRYGVSAPRPPCAEMCFAYGPGLDFAVQSQRAQFFLAVASKESRPVCVDNIERQVWPIKLAHAPQKPGYARRDRLCEQ